MIGYTSHLTCALCGSELDLRHEGTNTYPTRRIDVLKCRGRLCGALWAYVRELSLIAANDRCGSDAGYQRHRRNGERPCDECRRARAEAKRLRERVGA